jgi:hypothetical protein
MTRLEEVVARALDHNNSDEWTDLCIATIRLGKALAEFDNARKAYIRSQKEKQ